VKITLGSRGNDDDWPYAGVIDKATEFGAVVEEKGDDAATSTQRRRRSLKK
jgi:hypothetical protein